MTKAKTEEKPKKILSSESLAVKYRPKVLKDLIGQKTARTVIQGMINERKFPQAILITGNSGVGKTTVSRLLNRYINCATFDACGECESCKRFAHPDLIEFNMGDTRGIDDVRNIASASNIRPRFNKRIMLLDEVHALTKQAATALLVPLEKENTNTIFIMATTNPEKVLDTILGRCTRIVLNSISKESIVKRLKQVSLLEGYDDIEKYESTLEQIADFCKGQMRDALQMLESLLMCISSGSKFDPSTIIKQLHGEEDFDTETRAGQLLFHLLKKDMKKILPILVFAPVPRLLISKLRWVIHFELERQAIGKIEGKSRQFISQSSKAYLKCVESDSNFRAKPSDLLRLQNSITEAEMQMNTFAIDERVLLQSAIGRYIEKVMNDA